MRLVSRKKYWMQIVSANWIVKNRTRADGGYSHGESDKGGPFLP